MIGTVALDGQDVTFGAAKLVQSERMLYIRPASVYQLDA